MAVVDTSARIQEIYSSIRLSPRTFRALQIQPSRAFDSPIHCTLQRIQLSGKDSCDPQLYEALSYTWGSPEKTDVIILHGTTYAVGRNCFEALRRLRWKAGIRTVFVDAICINQVDSEELSSQIALMGDVYSQAHRVVAWLGEPELPGVISLGFRDLRRLYRLRPVLGNIASSYMARLVRHLIRSPIFSIQGMSGVTMACLCSADEVTEAVIGGRSIDFWLELVNTPYFERVWTLQETALARQCIMIFGDDKISFKEAAFGITFMAPHHADMIRWHSHNRNFRLRWRGFDAHNTLKDALTKRNTNHLDDRELWISLDLALSFVRRLESTDRSDKLYGLYGILQVLSNQEFPPPNKSLPLDIVWMHGTIGIIRGFRSIDLLYSVSNEDGCHKHRLRLFCNDSCKENKSAAEQFRTPRWTYDWGGLETSDTMKFHRQNDFLEIALPRGSEWDREPSLFSEAYGFTSLRTPPLISSALVVQGIRLGRIRAITNSADFLTTMLEQNSNSFDEAVDGKDEFFLQLTISLHARIEFLQEHCPDSDTVHILRNLLLWGHNPMDLYGPGFADVDLAKDFEAWYDHLNRTLSSESGGLADLVRRIERRLKTLMSLHSEQYHQELCISVIYQRMFVTDDGHVGSAFYPIQEGDFLVLLCWARMPAVLRPIGPAKKAPQRYLLIGFANVCDFMDCGRWEMTEDNLESFMLV